MQLKQVIIPYERDSGSAARNTSKGSTTLPLYLALEHPGRTAGTTGVLIEYPIAEKLEDITKWNGAAVPHAAAL
jgi:hypothetical protein